MAKNDVVLLDGIIDQRMQQRLPSERRDEVFELFAFEQLLKDYDLSQEEIEAGWVDGSDDGGIDGLYTFVNGHLIQDPSTFVWPKRRAELVLWVITCKHHDTFQQQPLNSLYTSITELLDLSLDQDELNGIYSKEVLDARSIFAAAYSRLAIERPALSIRFAYASRGIVPTIAENVLARASQLVDFAKTAFSLAESTFSFVGAEELVQLYRRVKKFGLSLPVQEQLSRGATGYIVLATLKDFARLVTDEGGLLRRYLFDSNVRDYASASQVNEDIMSSLQDASSPDFWWLNNGVTILATSATMVGKTLKLEDVQIVNGLQTTETIYRFFSGGGDDPSDRVLLVKIIVSAETTARDTIIRATNNQNVVETAALRATDKIQRDIEEHLDRYDWYYERRKNYYKNVGKPQERFVTPLYIAAGRVALLLKAPAAAASLRTRFMRNDESYFRVFSPSVPLEAWVRVVDVLKRVEALLEPIRPVNGSGERFMATWRNLVAFLCVSRTLGTFAYSIEEFIALDASKITSCEIDEAWGIIQSHDDVKIARKNAKAEWFVYTCCEDFAAKFGVSDIRMVVRASTAKKIEDRRFRYGRASTSQVALSPKILDEVHAALPPQPWKPGIRQLIADKLGLSRKDVARAIGCLVADGRRYNQTNGIVYSASGEIIATDPDRPLPGV